mgnify:FL=1|tara:strand:- start:49 stop:297 length:249 start_codon:yes stop_codon:yes gene_type:complete
MKINNKFIVSDFEIIKYNLLNLNNELVNSYLELFSSDPDNMPDFKYVNKLNNFLNKINSNYKCLNKISVNNEGEIKWEFKLK